jgi:hypothetical protein
MTTPDHPPLSPAELERLKRLVWERVIEQHERPTAVAADLGLPRYKVMQWSVWRRAQRERAAERRAARRPPNGGPHVA